MNKTIFILSLLAIGSFASIFRGSLNDPSPVPANETLLLSKIRGTFYEIAHIPLDYEKNCYCTRALFTDLAPTRFTFGGMCNLDSPSGNLVGTGGVGNTLNDEHTKWKLQIVKKEVFYTYITQFDTENYQWIVLTNAAGSAPLRFQVFSR